MIAHQITRSVKFANLLLELPAQEPVEPVKMSIAKPASKTMLRVGTANLALVPIQKTPAFHVALKTALIVDQTTQNAVHANLGMEQPLASLALTRIVCIAIGMSINVSNVSTPL